MPDDHSKLVPPLPIPNRTVKQLCADDSAATSVKVGYRQACYIKKPRQKWRGFFASGVRDQVPGSIGGGQCRVSKVPGSIGEQCHWQARATVAPIEPGT